MDYIICSHGDEWYLHDAVKVDNAYWARASYLLNDPDTWYWTAEFTSPLDNRHAVVDDLKMDFFYEFESNEAPRLENTSFDVEYDHPKLKSKFLF